MKNRMVLPAFVILLILAVPLTAVNADPVAPTIRQEVRAAGFVLRDTDFVLQRILYFDPGGAAPVHTHLSPVLVSVLDGKVDLAQEGTVKTFGAGEGFVETPGLLHSVSNAAKSRTTILVLNLVPAGQTPRVQVETKPGAPPDATSRLDLNSGNVLLPGQYDAVLQVVDFAPGALIPVQTVPGLVFTSVLEGEVTLVEGTTSKVYKTDQGWIEKADTQYSVKNTGNVKASLMISYIVPAGKNIANLSSPGLPNSGQGGGTISNIPTVWLLPLLVVVLGTSLFLRVRQGKR